MSRVSMGSQLFGKSRCQGSEPGTTLGSTGPAVISISFVDDSSSNDAGSFAIVTLGVLLFSGTADDEVAGIESLISTSFSTGCT